MAPYILVFFMMTSTGVGGTTQEFNTQERCMAAGESLAQNAAKARGVGTTAPVWGAPVAPACGG